jgi:hypothetical protein
MEKINFEKGIKLFVSPTDNGFACGVIKDDWMYTDEGYLCSVIARGMMKIACDNPQDVFEQGLEGFQEDIKNKKPPSDNGELKEEGATIIDIVPYFNKKKLN